MATDQALAINMLQERDQRPRLDLPHMAVLGKMGAGKTTAAEILQQKYAYSRASFAGLLKEVAVLVFGEGAATDRQLLQDLGSKVREIREDAWVNALLRRIDGWRGPVVIDDCRFPNEYWALRHMGFRFVRVHADEAIREDRLMKNGKLQTRAQFQHISETALDDIEAEHNIVNEGSELAFATALDSTLERIYKRQF